MHIISEGAKTENIYRSYQREEKPITVTNENISANSGNSKKTSRIIEKDTSKSKAAPNKAKKDGQEQGHEVMPSQKRVDVGVLEISIDDAIGKSRCVHL
jgi:hypothetical protein